MKRKTLICRYETECFNSKENYLLKCHNIILGITKIEKYPHNKCYIDRKWMDNCNLFGTTYASFIIKQIQKNMLSIVAKK